MDISSLPVDQVEALISQVLADRDPASVGLRRILRKKGAEQFDFPLRKPLNEEFGVPGKIKKVLSDEERRVIELERQNKELKRQISDLDERARESLQKAYAQGVEEGIRKGREKGVAQAALEYQNKLESMRDQTALVLDTFEREKESLFAGADQTLLALSLRIAKKIIATEPLVQPELVAGVLKKALAYVSTQDRLTIRVSPADFKTVSDAQDFWAPVNGRLKNIVIEQDDRIGRGGCIIDSQSGVVDARLDVQLEEIEGVIEKTLLSAAPSARQNTPKA